MTYTSSDEKVATVAADGKITGVATGTATITATTDYGKTAKIDVTVKAAFGITDLQATTASTLVATLAGPVSSEAKVEVTKSGIATPVAGEAKIDGTTVTFSTTANLTAGTYTLTVTDGNSTDSKSVEVKDEYVAEIVITSTQALTDAVDKDTAYIYYDVLNQYGESVRTSTSVEWSTSAKTIKADKATGKLTVTSDQNFVYGNQIFVTGVYTKTGVSVNKSVTVGMEQSLNSVKAVGFVNVNKPTEKLESLPNDFAKNTYYMIYETRDQENNLLDAAADNIAENRVTFVSDNILLVKVDTTEKVFTIDGVEYSAVLVQPGQYVDKGGEVNITAISNKTGNKSNTNFTVGSNALLKSLSITGPSDVVADGDAGVKLSYVAKDTNGNDITNYETIVRSTNTLSLSVSEGTLTVKEENDGTAGVYWSDKAIAWTDSVTADEIDRTIALTTVVVGGESNNYLLSVSDKRRPVAIKSINSVNGGANALVEADTETIDFSKKGDVVYLDQYGNDMDADVAAAFFDYSAGKGFGKSTKYAYGVKADFAGNGALGTVDSVLKSNNYVLTLEGQTTGAVVNDTVKFSIAQIAVADVNEDAAKWDVAGKVKSISFATVPVEKLTGVAFTELGKQRLDSNDTEDLNNFAESNKDITAYTGVLNLDGDGTTLKVVGKYSGKDLEIPADYYIVDSTNYAVAGNKLTAITATALKWSDLYDSNTARMTRKDATLPVSADVYSTTDKNADDKVGTITLNIKLSDEARKVTTVSIGETATKSATDTKADLAALFGGDYKVYDQYGAEITADAVTYTVTDLKEAATELTHIGDSLKATANGSATAALNGAEIGDTFKLTITATGALKSEASATVTVTVGADTWACLTNLANADKDLRVTLGYDR